LKYRIAVLRILPQNNSCKFLYLVAHSAQSAVKNLHRSITQESSFCHEGFIQKYSTGSFQVKAFSTSVRHCSVYSNVVSKPNFSRERNNCH